MKNRFIPGMPGACAALLCWAACGFAIAADGVVNFPVAPAQIQALGIRTAVLQKQSGAMHAAFPAQVAVPFDAQQVISAPVAGMVSQLMVQPNQAVKAGSPLLRMASPELGQLQLQLLQASSRAALARQAAERDKQLYEEGIIPQRRIQETQSARQEADAALHQAKAALRLSGMSNAAIAKLAASGTPQDGIVLSAAKAGIVTDIAVKPGQRVDAADALLHVVQTGTLWLEIQIPASEAAQWKAGTPLKVRGTHTSGRILSMGATVSADSQTLMLRAVLDGKPEQLRPGEFVTVELPVASAPDSWDIPLASVARDGNQAYVFVRTPDGFEARPVKIASSAGQQLRIQGALKAGEQIAVSGVVALKGAWLDRREQK